MKRQSTLNSFNVLPALIGGFVGLLITIGPADAANFLPDEAQPIVGRALSDLEPDSEGRVIIDDMIFDQNALRGRGFSGRRWAEGVLPIVFDEAVRQANRKRFFDACAEWTKVARVVCIERTTEPDYIRVQNSSFNRSYVGRIGGEQTLEIFNWTYKFIIAHEIGHALGLSHEQSRPDRGTFVEIHFDRIPENRRSNFRIIPMRIHTPYDFASIMHYGPKAFGSGQITISPKPGFEDQAAFMGNRRYLSMGDAEGMRQQYGAPVDAYPAVSGEDGQVRDGKADLLAVARSSAPIPVRSGVQGRAARSPIADPGRKPIFFTEEDARYKRNASAVPKIRGGLPVKSGTFQDIVGIAYEWDTRPSCGGVLIDKHWVLGAKHCVCDFIDDVVVITDTDESGQTFVKRQVPIKEAHPTPDDCAGVFSKDQLDLALFELTSPIEDVTPRGFASQEDIDAAERFRLVGHGQDETGSSGEKRTVEVPAVSNNCDGIVPGTNTPDSVAYDCHSGAEIVAGGSTLGPDSCKGDSGTPLLLGDGSRTDDDPYRIAGITSRETPDNEPPLYCGYGGVYVRITDNARSWISGVMTK